MSKHTKADRAPVSDLRADGDAQTMDDVAVCVDELVGSRLEFWTDNQGAEHVRGGLLAQVALLIPEPGSPAPKEVQFGHVKAPVSPTPWNDDAAAVFFEVHAGTRAIEAGLRMLLGYTPVRRDGSNAATVDSLTALPNLIRAALEQHPDHEPRIVRGRRKTVNPRRAARDIASWPRKCRELLDQVRKDEEQWTKAPGKLVCPYCDRALRLAPGWEFVAEQDTIIWCRNCPRHPNPDGETPHVSFEPGVWLGVLAQQAKDKAAAKERARSEAAAWDAHAEWLAGHEADQ